MKRICFSTLLAIGLLLVLGASHLIGQQAFALNSFVLYDSATGAVAPARPPGPVNVARNRPVSCSSIENTCALCWNAVDGNPATRWSSQFSAICERVLPVSAAISSIRSTVRYNVS